MHFTGYINNQLNGSDFKHKRMHILEFGPNGYPCFKRAYIHKHTHSLALSLSLSYTFVSLPSSLPNLGVPHDRPLSHLLLSTLGSLT